MRYVDPELQKIEQLGESPREEQEKSRQRASHRPGLFLVQGVVSLLLLLALAVCKWKSPLTYQEICSWYHSEIEREIVLPHWSGFAAKVTETDDSLQIV